MITNTPLGVYVPGHSLIHRMKPLVKCSVLILFIILTSTFVHDPYAATGCVLLGMILYALARIPVRIAWGQLFPSLPVLLVLGLFQWWQHGWKEAICITFVIFSALMLAILLTLTTTLRAMMDELESVLHPLKRFGVPSNTIVLAFSLTLRLIPLMLNTVNEVLAARKARGASFSLSAFGTPVLIRAIRRAQAITEALLARGVHDDSD
ncbi:energy-coupling factor transporter transmembrane protein EcfT [Corynebacterium sp. sy039]|uniref:energy-coupling factor transporter transmembrane component T family protein n=1 Tax=Corynebacterium sp. sy039 TaxID=2599641 RepID=UPI0011B47175|nr:energy-coupling factor transporter transmembrane protein EcfT [Corynebacterium sp. sy039]QDZ42775.1 energy-coupling factor transporter transmembrane protein EcfT [Corynebacterium sp. sy039]